MIALCGHESTRVVRGLCGACYQADWRRRRTNGDPLSPGGRPGALALEDERLLMQLLRDHHETSVEALAEKFGVSLATIRRYDLLVLDDLAARRQPCCERIAANAA